MRIVMRLLLVAACMSVSLPAAAWQGRMEAMQNPYGFVADESDFLVHPSLMADFQDITLFTHFAFGYEVTPQHDLDLDFPLAHPFYDVNGYDNSILTTSGLIVPTGVGNFGFAFTWQHDWGVTEGFTQTLHLGVTFDDLEYTRYDDDFVWSLFYATPVTDEINAGVRVDISYISREHELKENYPGLRMTNWPLFAPLVLRPVSERYGQADFTLSLDGDFAPYSFAASLHGGFLFAGNENVTFKADLIPGDISMNNNVNGWNIGGDVWLAYDVDEDLRIPLTFAVDYTAHSSMAAGTSYGTLGMAAWAMDTDYESTDFSIAAGIGVDYLLTDESRIGGGFTYTYSNGFERYGYTPIGFIPIPTQYDAFTQNHTFGFNLNAEIGLADKVALLCGGDIFIASTSMNTKEIDSYLIIFERTLTGTSYGFAGSIGLRAEFDGLVLEPFVGGGMTAMSLSGDSQYFSAGTYVFTRDTSLDMSSWFINTGISIAFDGF